MIPIASLRAYPLIEALESRVAPAFISGMNVTNLGGETGFRIDGAAVEDEAGWRVSRAGDLNNDGFDDVMLSSVAVSETGAVYVVYGSAGGIPESFNVSTLNGTNGFKIVAEPGAAIGQSIAAAGDVNGDGFDDLIIGSPGLDTVANANTGGAYVIFGKAATFGAVLELASLGSDGFRIVGAAANDLVGNVVSGAGDVNDDGWDDLLVSWSSGGTNHRGLVYVVFGKASGLTGDISVSTLNGTTGFTVQGAAADDLIGETLSPLGDVNGDGKDDFGIGTGQVDAGGVDRTGAVYVIFGKSTFSTTLGVSTLNGTNGFRLEGAHELDSASRVAGGDLNGDGFSDVIVGAALVDASSGPQSGAVYVVYGKPAPFAATLNLGSLNGANGFTLLDGGQQGAGTSVGVGDINGDGLDDLLIGTVNSTGAPGKERAYVLFGRWTPFASTILLPKLQGPAGLIFSHDDESSAFGEIITTAGDVNGDGFADLLISAHRAKVDTSYGQGSAYVVYGFRVHLAANGKSASFLDLDGDEVTVTASKGTFRPEDFHFGATGGLQKLDLTRPDGGFAGAKISIVAKRGTQGGNSFVNVGFIDATGVDLGTVSVGGDLSRLDAGTVGGEAKVPALKALTAQTIGLLGTSTQGPGPGLSTGVTLQGGLPKLTLKTDLRAAVTLSGADGTLGTASIGGSIIDTGAGFAITAEAGIGAIKVGGDIVAAGSATALIISTDGAIGKVTVKGSITSLFQAGSITIRAFGQLTIPAKGPDLAIGSIAVTGSMDNAIIAAGSTGGGNADASIGSIIVGREWLTNEVRAGVAPGPDLKFGTQDDVKLSGEGVRDEAQIFSRIGSLTIKGQALGSPQTAGDMFGVVAEQIAKAKIGARTLAFQTGTSEAFYAAATGAGAGAESPIFDFMVRELGSTTPTIALGGPNLVIAANGKSATFTDVDGDLVTVKRTAGTFAPGDFNITTTASGGGQLRTLTLTAAPGDALVGLSITAKTGAEGGNSFVNVGRIVATGVPLGAVVVGGDLGRLDGGLAIGTKPGVASLTARTIGYLGTTTGAPNTVSTFTGGVGKVTILSEVFASTLYALGTTAKLAAVSIGGNFRGVVQSDFDIGPVKIGGSLITGIVRAKASIGAISIGGNLLGSFLTNIEVFGQKTEPAKGLDFALKSLTVKGSMEGAFITTFKNADAAIGAVRVGREWIASSIVAGMAPGEDNLFFTTDDVKESGSGVRDVENRFSSIASVIIKGQAIGTFASNTDHGGVSSETIGKLVIGKAVYKFTKGPRHAADSFAASPTGPGFGGMPSDFYVREISA